MKKSNSKNSSGSNNVDILEIVKILLEQCSSKYGCDQLPVVAADHTDVDFGDEVLSELEQRGFAPEVIHKALRWFLSLMVEQRVNDKNITSDAIRIFSNEEVEKMGRGGCGFVLSLERAEILDHNSREVVINQLMQLPQEKCTEDEVRWVVLMVLLCQRFNTNDDSKVCRITSRIEKYSLYLM